MEKLQGKLVSPWDGDSILKGGEYGKHPKTGDWYCSTPNGHMGNLSGHTVMEHDDGTITVSPSILVSGYCCKKKKKDQELWHGYLEKGIWRSC